MDALMLLVLLLARFRIPKVRAGAAAGSDAAILESLLVRGAIMLLEAITGVGGGGFLSAGRDLVSIK